MTPQKKYFVKKSIAIIVVTIITFGLEILCYNRISDTRSSITETEYRIAKIGLQSETLVALKKRYQAIEEDIPVVDTALPSTKETEKLLSDLDSLAKQSNLKFTDLEASTISSTKKAPTDPSLRQTVKGKNGYELPWNVQVNGSFNSFVTFLKKIENYQRLVNINSMEITREVNPNNPFSDLIEVKLKITAYLQK